MRTIEDINELFLRVERPNRIWRLKERTIKAKTIREKIKDIAIKVFTGKHPDMAMS